MIKRGRILLLGGNYLPEPTGIGKYNGEMMEHLSNIGYECTTITTYPYYPYWQTQAPYRGKAGWYSTEKIETAGLPVTIYRCPHYVPENPSASKRMLSELSFFISAAIRLILLLFQKRYDYVMVVAPPFQLGLLGILYKYFKGAKFIYHIQDLQIDAARELKMIKSGTLLRTMLTVESYILKKADFVSTISEGMILRIMKKCKKPVIYFPNWVDTEYFYPIAKKDSLKASFNLCSSDKIILYSGAIGEKQGLELIVDAAKTLFHENFKFVICGSGPYKEKLMNQVRMLGLNNILFYPLQPKNRFNDFLNMADVHLVLQKSNANDLVMPSKLSTILAVGGLALVTASRKTSLHNIISRNDMGILVEPENQAALTDCIKSALAFSYHSIQENARAYALNFLTKSNVIESFLSEINAVPVLQPQLPEIMLTEKETSLSAKVLS